ncbi:nucleolar protein 12-domain-containing protein [Roridomyces roridus]|uniref:Nucleolar protein 12-domain-containing protein n=1 Tax=Roridomyces roridus TaxID=1738132 RepID=A0AAD7G0E6_9AGAR|nr:nucleolar protein 12-domain-containing protein [Roridomyces roridus]
MASNISSLTRSHRAIAAKKRAKESQVKEVLFDDEARREFLTGFHKRKLAKADAARKKAVEREKQERQESRREQRRHLRERAIANATEVEKAYGADDGHSDQDEWGGISDVADKGKGRQMEEEYEDEDMLATVTVVEDFDPDALIHGPRPRSIPAAPSTVPAPPVKAASSERPKKKTKPKKVRYETKDARMRERTKQRARKTEKAELAGGKASRKRTVKGRGNKK